MINFMRNMGASVGTSLVTTLVARQTQRHQVYLTGRLGPNDPSFREQLEAPTALPQTIEKGSYPSDADGRSCDKPQVAGGCPQALTGSLRCLLISAGVIVAPFPFHVGDLKQGNIIFKADAVKVIEGQIAFHRFPEILYGLIELFQFRQFFLGFV
jgi:hypothetical protein